MVLINSISISPPLLNSACRWSSDLPQLSELYHSPYTGAITTRTATLNGYEEDESHIVAFNKSPGTVSINSYGYSPHPFAQYLIWIEELLSNVTFYKPIIVSLTSDVDDPVSLATMISQLQELRKKTGDQAGDGKARIAVELNTSCPNIKDAPPPGYDLRSLDQLLQVLSDEYAKDPTLTIGLKLPPFVHKQQFHSVLDRILSLNLKASRIETGGSVISFLTCTNTLGSSLLFTDQNVPGPSSSSPDKFALPAVFGGLAGDALHPLALGNVYQFSQLLKGLVEQHLAASKIKIIGVGGVTSKEAKERMMKVGADVVACATLLGTMGIRAFSALS